MFGRARLPNGQIVAAECLVVLAQFHGLGH